MNFAQFEIQNGGTTSCSNHPSGKSSHRSSNYNNDINNNDYK